MSDDDTVPPNRTATEIAAVVASSKRERTRATRLRREAAVQIDASMAGMKPRRRRGPEPDR